MRKALVVLAVVGGVGVGLWVGPGLLRWGVEQALSYVVGASVRVGQVKALTWEGNLRWRLELQDVYLSSTLPGDTCPTARLHRVQLTGQGRHLKEVVLQQGWVTLIRLATAQKNFRYFPRRGRPLRQRFGVKAKEVRFSLLNIPANLTFSLQVDTLEARLDIDSAVIQLEALQARLLPQEVCWRQVWPSLPAPLELRAQGCLHKPMQNWERLTLSIEAPEEGVHFSGCVENWTHLWGSFAGRVGGGSRFAKYAAGLAELGVNTVEAEGWIGGREYGVCLWGAWKRGSYRVCLGGWGPTLRTLQGTVEWKEFGWASFKGSLDKMALWGSLSFPGLHVKGKGWISPSRRMGRLTLATSYGDTVRAEGSLDTLSGQLYLSGQRLKGTWTKKKGLQLSVDSLSLGELMRAWAPYRPLLQKGGVVAIPVHLQARVFRWDTLAEGKGLWVRLEPNHGLEAGAQVYLPFWPETLESRAWRSSQTDSWAFSLQGKVGYLHAEGTGDTAWVSATGLWRAYPWQVAGTVNFQKRTLWLRQAWAGGPSAHIEVQGALSPTEASAEVEATVPLTEVLSFFPLEGMRVSAGCLNTRFCAQGTWDTLLRWDNPLEGTATLEGVQAYFPQLGLPLLDFSVRVAFSPEETRLLQLSGKIGATQVRAQGQLRGTLSYLYTDWYRLQGHLDAEAESLRVDDFWRRVEGQSAKRQVRLPLQMDLQLQARLRSVDLYGLPFEEVAARAQLKEGLLEVDTLGLLYGKGHLTGWGVLDIADSTCYTFSGRATAQGIDVAALLQQFELDTLRTFRRLGLKGLFSGSLQMSLRFSPSVAWRENSSFFAQGQVSRGQFYTPRWLRWLRLYYLAAYRDSMDFWAEVPSLQITDGFLRLEEGLLVTRAGALRLVGYHYLPQDRFLYQIRGARLYRRLQRQAHLPVLAAYMEDLLDQTLFLVYVEKLGPQVRVRYPVRYLLRRLVVPPPAEPLPFKPAHHSGGFFDR